MEYTVIRKNVKRISLRVLSNGSVQLTAPKNVSKETLDRMVEEKNIWIEVQRQKIVEKQSYRELNGLVNEYRDGGNIVFLGRGYPLQVKQEGKKQLDWNGEKFFLTGCNSEQSVKKMVEEFYRTQLEEIVIPQINREARQRFVGYDLPDPEITVRKMKSSWGICYYKENRIRLNLWLGMAPEECIRQVLLHEYVHFFQPNHSSKFYAMLESAEPRYQELKNQLNKTVSLRE